MKLLLLYACAIVNKLLSLTRITYPVYRIDVFKREERFNIINFYNPLTYIFICVIAVIRLVYCVCKAFYIFGCDMYEFVSGNYEDFKNSKGEAYYRQSKKGGVQNEQ